MPRVDGRPNALRTTTPASEVERPRSPGTTPAPESPRLDAIEHGRGPTDAVRTRTNGGPLDDVVPALQLTVTARDADLNTDGSSERLHRTAAPTATLSIDEILQAPQQRRDELLRRYQGMLQTRLGASADAAVDGMTDRTIKRGPWQVTLAATAVDISSDDGSGRGHKLHVDLATPGKPQLTLEPDAATPDRGAMLAFALKAFGEMLFEPARPGSRGQAEPELAKLFGLLLGPQGLLNPQDTAPLKASDRFLTPKLIAWDFNGTVGDGKSSFRPDMRDVTDNLNRMGAASVITTTIDPLPVEKLMGEANIRFNGFFGYKEVRDYPANKHYRGVAESYGLDLDAARGRLAVIGDSETDIPSDLSGVLFVHNDDQTPAEAIERLLHRLDQEGGGRFDQGLEKLLRDRGIDALPCQVELDNLSFTVELRDGGLDGKPCQVPVICELRVHFDTAELTTLLGTLPDPALLASHSRYDLGLRYIEGELEPARLPEVLRGLDHAADKPAVIAAGARRIQDRQALCGRARTVAEKLLTSTDARPFDDLLELCQRLASVGDSAVATSLAVFADQFDDINARAKPLALQQLTDDCAKLRRLLDQATRAAAGAPSAVRPLTTRVDASTEEAFFSKNEKAARDLFKTLASNPLDDEVIPRQALIKRLELYLKQPFPGVADSFAAMVSHLGAAEHQARRKLVELFAERMANRSQLNALVPVAERAAARAEPIWAEVAAAWRELSGT